MVICYSSWKELRHSLKFPLFCLKRSLALYLHSLHYPSLSFLTSDTRITFLSWGVGGWRGRAAKTERKNMHASPTRPLGGFLTWFHNLYFCKKRPCPVSPSLPLVGGSDLAFHFLLSNFLLCCTLSLCIKTHQHISVFLTLPEPWNFVPSWTFLSFLSLKWKTNYCSQSFNVPAPFFSSTISLPLQPLEFTWFCFEITKTFFVILLAIFQDIALIISESQKVS